MVKVMHVRRAPGSHAVGIGEDVAAELNATQAAAGADATVRVVAVVPRLLALFASSPQRYEVAEADVLYELVRREDA